METTFFDAYVSIGPYLAKHPAQPWRLEDLLDEMRHCSVAGALVSHRLSVAYDPMYGNRLLSRMLEGRENLFPIWNVMPDRTGQFPAPAALLDEMAARDVRAVTLHPRTNRWELLSETSVSLLKALEAQQILTIIRPAEFDRFYEFECFLKRYPRLPVLLTHVSWGEERYVSALVSACPNLHLCFTHLQVHCGLEQLVERGYADRLLFASNYTEMSMGAHRAYVSYAEVPEEARARIAGGNLRRLLKGQGPVKPAANPDEDDLMRAARLGQPLPAPVIDPHMHLLHEGLMGDGRSTMYAGDAAGIRRHVERLGYKAGGLMSWSVIVGDSVGGNEAVRHALDVFPETYWGMASFDPCHYSQEELRRMIPELYADRRFKGAKPFFFVPRYDDPLYDVWWEYLDAHNLMVLLDRNRSDTDFSEVDNLARRFPNVSWIVPHCGAHYRWLEPAVACARAHPSVYLDITYTNVTAGIIESLVEGAGVEKIVYGSDLPMRDPRQQVGWVVYSRLTPEEKAKILGGNMRRILERCRP